jgi:hypothetical protein
VTPTTTTTTAAAQTAQVSPAEVEAVAVVASPRFTG